jgi:hypothetical protein
MSCYDDVESKVEYLDLSHRQLGVEGVLDVLHDLGDDTILRHVNLSYNIGVDEFRHRDNVDYFIKRLKKYLTKNQGLTALDLAGNYLFHYHPHPSNEHIKYYEIELTEALLSTGISRIDLSDNHINGYTGREFKGYIYFLKKYLLHREGFVCRRSLMNSLGLMSLASFSLGIHSSLTYLDLSENNCGLDPQGSPTSEGIQALSSALAQSLQLRTLKLARNFIRDVDVEIICSAVQVMPQFQDLDLSGNLCKHYGIRAVREAVIAHSIVCDTM